MMRASIVLTCFFAGATLANGVPTEWTGTEGSWFDPIAWSRGVPNLDSTAVISNDGTVLINEYWAHADQLYLGKEGSGAVFLTGGGVSFTDMIVSPTDTATFVQSGGRANIANELILRGEYGGVGTYHLSDDGNLTTGSTLIGAMGSGSFVQSGGVHHCGYLNIQGVSIEGNWPFEASRYTFTGGELIIDEGLAILGALCMQDQPATISVGDTSLVNLGANSLVGTSCGALHVGANSLTIYTPGQHPADMFAEFATKGMLHERGQTLVLSAGQSFGGAGVIEDFIQCNGNITGSSNAALWLTGGLSVGDGGSVSLPVGGVQISNCGNSISQNGSLETDTLRLCGSSGAAEFTQTGGEVAVGSTLGVLEAGMYTLEGGRLSVGTLVTAGTGLFNHSGGRLQGESIRIGGGGQASYELSDEGEIDVDSVNVTGSFLQTGGHLTTQRGSISGIYHQSGGDAFVDDWLEITSGGEWFQIDGANHTNKLFVKSEGRYDLVAGDLYVDRQLTVEGEFNCGATPGTLAVGDAIVDFSRGAVLNAENAVLTAGDNALIIHAPGAAPEDLFGSFTTNGLVHEAGQTLVIPAGRTVAGAGWIYDPVQCQGAIAAATGERMYLAGGLTLAPNASVDLQNGFVGGNQMGVRLPEGGSLTASWISGGDGGVLVGPNSTLTAELLELGAGDYRQTGGQTVLGSACCSPDAPINGTYELTGGVCRVGSFTPLKLELGGDASLIVDTLTLTATSYRDTLPPPTDTTPRSLEITSLDASLEITDSLRLGTGSISSVYGATIRVTGSEVTMESQSPQSADGMANLCLVFAGGEEKLATLEAFAEDTGPIFERMSIASLVVGDEQSSGLLAVVDNFDNVDDFWNATEALYLDSLTVQPGSTLLLPQCNLYVDGKRVQNGDGALYGGGTIFAAAISGDANFDNTVDIADFIILKNHWNTNTTQAWMAGDFNIDGIVDIQDFVILRNSFGASASTAVPEPATLALLLAGGPAWIGRRRWRRRA